MLNIVHGLPGSGKSSLIKRLPEHFVKLPQCKETQKIPTCVKLVEEYVYDYDVYLETWGWKYPEDKPYQINHLYFGRDIPQCMLNVIYDAVKRGYIHGRMEALIRGTHTYFPPRDDYKVYQRHVHMDVVDKYFVEFPQMDEHRDFILEQLYVKS